MSGPSSPAHPAENGSLRLSTCRVPGAPRPLRFARSRRSVWQPRPQQRQASSRCRHGRSCHQWPQAGLSAIFKDFAGNTTAHGIRQLAQANGWCRRIVWAAILTVVTAGVATHLTVEVMHYFSYPISVQTSFILGGYAFPDVIICDPIGPINPRLTLRRNASSGPAGDILIGTEDAIVLPDSGELQQKDKFRFFLSHFIDLPASGLQPADYIIFCRYQKLPCTFLNFSVYYHHDFMNCFVFRPPTRLVAAAGPDSGLTLVLNVPQRSSVESFSEFGERYEEALLPLGLRVSLQQADTVPRPSEGGWMLPKGMLTEISTWHFRSALANTPVAPCSGESSNLRQRNHATGRIEEFYYRKEDCEYNRLVERAGQVCNCSVHADYPLGGSGNSSSDDGGRDRFVGCHEPFRITRRLFDMILRLRKAGHSHIGDQAAQPAMEILEDAASPLNHIIDCFQEARRQPVSHSDCPNPCEFDNYVTAVSQALWPQQELLSRIKELLLDSIHQEYFNTVRRRGLQDSLIHPLKPDFWDQFAALEGCTAPDCFSRINRQIFSFMEENFLELRVFPRSLDIQYTEERCNFPLSSLLSQLGGLSGLWLGISIVTVCEFIDFLGALVRRLFSSTFRERLTDTELVTELSV
ncbi:hypothetical protein BOX15_Mlig030622g1 [Macrostomum lignano]|uniref:Amiloride-sensitive sodium channel n=1 Tax=Macrostomum lignano TaxID=282301 RepID=A0A267E617_9PLAT|nr:hypothetical protein BOX15_Mlig030622g1 [Macrostomum lignano]